MTHHGAGLRKWIRDENKVRGVERDYTKTELTERERAMLNYAVKLARTPESMQESDVERLRHAGFGDSGILDICMVTAYFSYVNRIAQGLGVELEDYWNGDRTE